ncbi:MAG: hypothetical protein WBP26_01540 [Candidatus Saccharimonadales bacterium]
MRHHYRYFKIFVWAAIATGGVVITKYLLHLLGWEFIEQSSLHNAVISSAIFVMGFILSATIADYKESEKIPSEFAAHIQDMYDDARSLQKTYPKFSMDLFRENLMDILGAFREGTRKRRLDARREIADLHITFIEMEKAGVPPNYIIKLKTQQAQLLKSLFRVNYIQKIRFIPSAFVLARSIIALVVAMLLFTNIDPYGTGLIITGIITFMMVYMLLLIKVISTPFHEAGNTKDDVSLFLLREVKQYLKTN